MRKIASAISALREEILEKFRDINVGAEAFYKDVENVPFVKTPIRIRRRNEPSERIDVGVRPAVFHRLLDDWCRSSTALMKDFVEELCKLRDNVDWVEREAEKSWPAFNAESGVWVDIACKLGPRALAPGRRDLEPEAMAKVAGKVRSQIEGRLARARRSALNRARILIVQKGNESNRGKKQQRPEKLPPKQGDSSRFFDAAHLTPNQREVMSLRWEHMMSKSAAARYLGRDRKTIDEHEAAAFRKLGWERTKKLQGKKGAVTDPGKLEI